MNFSRKSLTISFIITVTVFLFTLITPILNPIFAALIILFIYYFLLYWLLDFDIQASGFFNILLLSSFYIQSFTMFSLTILKNTDTKGILLFLFLAVIFVSIEVANRIANITNVSFIKRIPLFQVSQSFNYIFSVLAIFVSILTFFLSNVPLIFLWGYTLLILILCLYSNLSLIERSDRRLLLAYSIISTIINYAFAFFLFFIELNSIIKAFIISLIYFILLGNYFSLIKQSKLSVLNVLIMIFYMIIIIAMILFSPVYIR